MTSTRAVKPTGRAAPRRGEAHQRWVEERIAAGKALRNATPRAAHAQLAPTDAQSRDIVAVLNEQARSRLAPLVPVRHTRRPVTGLQGEPLLTTGGRRSRWRCAG
jgi:hypothetical protein